MSLLLRLLQDVCVAFRFTLVFLKKLNKVSTEVFGGNEFSCNEQFYFDQDVAVYFAIISRSFSLPDKLIVLDYLCSNLWIY